MNHEGDNEESLTSFQLRSLSFTKHECTGNFVRSSNRLEHKDDYL